MKTVVNGLVSATFMFLMSCTKETAIQPTDIPHKRIMCWYGNGDIYIDMMAKNIDYYRGLIRFIPVEGKQTGKLIYTTTTCSWEG